LRVYPILDGALVAFWIVRHYVVWSRWRADETAQKQAHQHNERELAAAAMKDSIAGAMTGTSIVIAAVAAILGLGRSLPAAAIDHLRIAALAGVISLGFAVYTLAGLPSMVNRLNVAYQRDVNLRLVIQLWLSVVAAARLALGIFNVLPS
jgi:hypothetical protein